MVYLTIIVVIVKITVIIIVIFITIMMSAFVLSLLPTNLRKLTVFSAKKKSDGNCTQRNRDTYDFYITFTFILSQS